MGHTRLSLGFSVIFAGLVVGCASPTKDASNAFAGTAECAWPANLEAKDGGLGTCEAKRYFLKCEGTPPTGTVFALCLSDDPTTCPALSTTMPGVAFTCVSQCGPSEYGIACGGIGRAVDPPSSCKLGPPAPGGSRLGCCPCG